MVFRQNGKWGLVFAIAATEAKIRSPHARAELAGLLECAERLRHMLGATHLSFSGVLPGVLSRHGLGRDAVEAQVTVAVVRKAVDDVFERNELEPTAPVIIIGSRGYIGRRLLEALAERYEVVGLDINGDNKKIPQTYRGRRGLVVNVASRRALQDYVDDLWEGLIYLNEVYPEPSPDERRALAARGVPAYHVVGVRAVAVPPFPLAYRGGIPCCAAREHPDLDVLVRRLA